VPIVGQDGPQVPDGARLDGDAHGMSAQGRLCRPDNNLSHHDGWRHWMRPSEARLP